MHKNRIQAIFTILPKKECLIRKTLLLVFGRVVFLEELEVFIKAFGSVEDIEIVFRNYKIIEFMVSECGNRGQVFGECFKIFYGCTYLRQICHECDCILIIKNEITGF